MAVANPARTKAAASPSEVDSPMPIEHTHELPDLLAGMRWGTRQVMAAAAIVVAIDLFAGWTYLASYFGYFRIPVEGLGLGFTEVLVQGLRTVLLPLTVIVLAGVAPTRRLRPAALAVGGYLVFLAIAALANHWASPGAVFGQLAASAAIAGVVFGLRMGFGRTQPQRLLIGAVGLLLLLSIPVASGTLDATQKAASRTTTLRVVTSTAALPSGAASNGHFTYSNYVLLRESDTRYWLFRIGDQYAYSIAKSDVLYIRY